MSDENWPSYTSHKRVKAAKIIIIDRDEAMKPIKIMVDPGNHEPEEFWPTKDAMAEDAQVGWWAIAYADGFRSISPPTEFEEGYTAD